MLDFYHSFSSYFIAQNLAEINDQFNSNFIENSIIKSIDNFNLLTKESEFPFVFSSIKEKFQFIFILQILSAENYQYLHGNFDHNFLLFGLINLFLSNHSKVECEFSNSNNNNKRIFCSSDHIEQLSLYALSQYFNLPLTSESELTGFDFVKVDQPNESNVALLTMIQKVMMMASKALQAFPQCDSFYDIFDLYYNLYFNSEIIQINDEIANFESFEKFIKSIVEVFPVLDDRKLVSLQPVQSDSHQKAITSELCFYKNARKLASEFINLKAKETPNGFLIQSRSHLHEAPTLSCHGISFLLHSRIIEPVKSEYHKESNDIESVIAYFQQSLHHQIALRTAGFMICVNISNVLNERQEMEEWISPYKVSVYINNLFDDMLNNNPKTAVFYCKEQNEYW